MRNHLRTFGAMLWKLISVSRYLFIFAISLCALVFIGSFWFIAMLEASHRQVPAAYSRSGTAVPQNFASAGNAVVTKLVLSDFSYPQTIGNEELGQLPGSNSAAAKHIRFEKDRKTGNLKVANVARSRGLLLEYSDGEEYRSSIAFLSEGMRIGANIADQAYPEIKISRIDGRLIEFEVSTAGQSTSYTIDANGFEPLLDLTPEPDGFSPHCRGRRDGLPKVVDSMASSLADSIADFRSAGLRPIARFGGSRACVTNGQAAIPLANQPFSAFRIVYSQKRGFAVTPGSRNTAYVILPADADERVRVSDYAHPLVLAEETESASAIVLEALVAGRTRYLVNVSTDPQEKVTLHTSARAHRIPDPCPYMQGRSCSPAPASGQVWLEEISNAFSIGTGTALLIMFTGTILVLLILTGLFVQGRGATDPGAERRAARFKLVFLVLAALPFLQWMATRTLGGIGFDISSASAMMEYVRLALNPLASDIPAIAYLPNPVPAALAWGSAAAMILVSPRTTTVLRVFILAITALVATGTYTLAFLGFSSPEMRYATYYEESLKAIQVGAIMIAFAAWVPESWLRRFMGAFLSADRSRPRFSFAEHLGSKGSFWRIPGELLLSLLFAAYRVAAYLLNLAGPLRSVVAAFFAGAVGGWIWSQFAVTIPLFSAALGGAGMLALLAIDRFVGALLALANGSVTSALRTRADMDNFLVVLVRTIGLPVTRSGYVVRHILTGNAGKNASELQPSFILWSSFAGYLHKSPWNFLMYFLLFLTLAGWLVFGAEEGIAGLLQPSEIIKAMVVFNLSVLVANMQQRNLITGGTIWFNLQTSIQTLLLIILFLAVFFVPVVKSDHSPFLILGGLVVLSFLIATGIHLIIQFARYLRRHMVFGQPPSGFLGRRGRDPTRSFTGLLAKPAMKPLWRLYRKSIVVGGLIIAVPLLFAVFAKPAIDGFFDDPGKMAASVEKRFGGELHTPFLRARSWIELLPERLKAHNSAPDRSGPIDIDYTDTGRQVLLSRKVIAKSGCHRFQALDDGVFSNLLSEPVSRIQMVASGLRKTEHLLAGWLSDVSGRACGNLLGIDREEAIGTALDLPAIHNDFATTWLYASLHRDGIFLVLALQVTIVISMLAAGYLAATRLDGSMIQQFVCMLSGYAVIGFAVLYTMHWGLSALFSIGRLPVMGQPSTFISAGNTHFLFVGMIGIVAVVLSERLRAEPGIKREMKFPVMS